MKVDFKYLPEFEHRAKNMAKKYKSFIRDYDAFLDALEKDPYQGVSLGGGVYKTRMAITSKGKGKCFRFLHQKSGCGNEKAKVIIQISRSTLFTSYHLA